MPDTQHSTLSGADAHSPYRWVVADQTAMDAVVPVAADVLKTLYKSDTAEVFTLASIGPVVWQPINKTASLNKTRGLHGPLEGEPIASATAGIQLALTANHSTPWRLTATFAYKTNAGIEEPIPGAVAATALVSFISSLLDFTLISTTADSATFEVQFKPPSTEGVQTAVDMMVGLSAGADLLKFYRDGQESNKYVTANFVVDSKPAGGTITYSTRSMTKPEFSHYFDNGIVDTTPSGKVVTPTGDNATVHLEHQSGY